MFSDTDAELLAMEISGALLPPSELYEQIHHDLTAIRQKYPSLATVRHRCQWAPGQLLVKFTDKGLARFEKGEYKELEALNTKYGPVKTHPFTGGLSYNFIFEQRYNSKCLASLYQAVDGVARVDLNWSLGDGNDIELSNGQYKFKVGWGDCMAGCIHRHYWVFTVVDDAVSLVDEHGSPLITGLNASNDGPVILGHATSLKASVANDSYRANFTWDFGDGTSGEGAVVDHTYPATGNYTAIVTASSFDSSVSATTTVVVIPDVKPGG